MPRVRLIHWNGDEGRECKGRLASLGYDVDFDALDEPHMMKALRAMRSAPPAAVVIDLSRLPAHGRTMGMTLRGYKDTRHVPLVFVDGDPEKVKQVKALLPDATYTTWSRLKTALPRALARPVTNPVVPPSNIYTGRPPVDKLGVKSGMRVCLLGAPKGFAGTLTPTPADVTFTAKASDKCDLFLAFVRSRHDLVAQLGSLASDVTRQTVWAIWPKQASGVKSDLNGNVVRETGLASGWVDFKICAIDDTWSGLAFKRRQ